MTLQSHRALELPELLHSIFSLLDRQSNVANAQVCEVWFNVALDALWGHVDKIHRLFAILAPLKNDSKEGFAFERSPRPTDWKRFDKYANHVRWIEYHGFPKLAQIVFDEIARTRRQLEIFPNLQTIDWKESDQINLSSLFMHSGIQKLELFVQDHPSETFFEEIVDRMPNLSDLHITIYSVSTVRIVEDLAKLLQQLPNLHQITLPRFCYAARIFEVLSRLQLLCTIKFSEESGSGAGSLDTWPESFRPTMISEGAFSTLQNLSVTTNYDSIASLLQSSFTPSALTYFNINSVIVEMPNSLHKLVFVVSKRFQELKRLCLDSARGYTIENFTDTNGHGRNITLQTLKPLFKLPYLTSFEFYHQYPLIITQQDIETIASSCPAIEKLELCSNPVFCMKSALTLEALIPLAQHCTQLKSLGLFIDATRVPEISPEIPPKPFTSLRILSFGLSIINDAMPTVYLSQLIPPECVISSFDAWWHGRRGDPGEFQQIATQRSRLWSLVGKLVSKLSSIITHERQRTRALECELEELRVRMAAQQD